jgi:hypothetical protein
MRKGLGGQVTFLYAPVRGGIDGDSHTSQLFLHRRHGQCLT